MITNTYAGAIFLGFLDVFQDERYLHARLCHHWNSESHRSRQRRN